LHLPLKALLLLLGQFLLALGLTLHLVNDGAVALRGGSELEGKGHFVMASV
jgi:hypothetical protein